MIGQPVTLEHYFFSDITVSANPSWRPDTGAKNGRPHASIATNCEQVSGEDNLFEVQLTITIEDTEDHPSQYNVKLVAIGVLRANKDLHDKEKNMAVTGASILYSASREFLLGIMLRGPWPPIMLHAMPFHIPAPPKAASPAKDKKPVAKKIKP